MTDNNRNHRLILDGVPPPREWHIVALMVVGYLYVIGLTAALLVFAGVYYRYSPGLPEIPRVEDYPAPVVSEMYSDDLVLTGEFYDERRKLLPYNRIPKRLIQALIASEDSSFFDHFGIDVLGTARALFNTGRSKIGMGGSVQGGSTLTQQTAKALLVSAEGKPLLDQGSIEAEAEKRVAPFQAPTNEQIAAEVKDQKKKLVLGPDWGKEDDDALRDRVRDRLTKIAIRERREAVREARLRVREERMREAHRKGTAKKLERKIREALLAIRLERAFTKEEILHLYLNNVYLGHQSYGVQSAAENYFRKDVSQLTLAEIAILGGLPQAPSRYSPFIRPEAAKKRRGYVLSRMLDEGMISKAEFDIANEEPITVFPVEDVFRKVSPYFSEEVRREVVEKYGSRNVLTSGLKIFTTMDSERQRAAQEAVLDNLLAVDKRQGYRGPVAKLEKPEERSAFIERSKKVIGSDTLVLNQLYLGLVTAVDAEGKMADVTVGPHQGKLPLLGMRWARNVNPEGYYPSMMLESMKRVVKVGDVLVLRAVAQKQLADDKEQFDLKLDKEIPKDVPLFRLEQEPELQAALVSIDPGRDYVVAMVGGYDFEANEYNRAFQACRQPGSAFKPFTYSAAIEKLEYTPATVIVDSPIVTDSDDTGVRWKPSNFSEEFKGEVLLRNALVLSLNIPAIKVFGAVGVKAMSDWVKKFGISTPMNLDFSSALGSSCVLPYELADAYATFNRLGAKRPSHFVRKVEDRFGRTLEDHTAIDDAWAPLHDRLAAGYADLFDQSEQVMTPETGWIMNDLLRAVVKDGTGAPAQKLGKPAAGKTGTTNDSFDAWFAGYTRNLVTVTWVGYDLNPHPLGRFETGGRASLPMWVEYMQRALEGRTQPEFGPPAALSETVVLLKIDPKTGKVAAKDNRHAQEMWFKKGTEPIDAEHGKDVVDPDAAMINLPN